VDAETIVWLQSGNPPLQIAAMKLLAIEHDNERDIASVAIVSSLIGIIRQEPCEIELQQELDRELRCHSRPSPPQADEANLAISSSGG